MLIYPFLRTAGPEAVPAQTYDYDMLNSFVLQRKKDVDSGSRDDKVDDVGGGDDVGGKDDVAEGDDMAEGDGLEAGGNSEQKGDNAADKGAGVC